jgi:hypothetical protein
MTKYPLDRKGIENIVRDIQQNDIYQKDTILQLSNLLLAAVPYMEDMEWNEKTEHILTQLNDRAKAFENLRFDQGNGYKLQETSPYEQKGFEIETTALTTPEPEQIPDTGEMTEDELARYFKEPKLKLKETLEKPVDKMTLDEIEAWEAKQDNSNEIYKVSARIKNLARLTVKGNLTAQGEMLANMFTHVIKAYYDFADTLIDKEVKIRLIELTKRQEDVPANLIAALGAGVKTER